MLHAADQPDAGFVIPLVQWAFLLMDTRGEVHVLAVALHR